MDRIETPGSTRHKECFNLVREKEAVWRRCEETDNALSKPCKEYADFMKSYTACTACPVRPFWVLFK